MSTNGQLVFTDVDKITFKGVGNASNAVVDTLTGKIGVGVDSPDANLHVLGNSYVSTNLELGGTLIMGTVNVEAQHSLEAVTATGNTTPLTIEFTNPTTSLVASGNMEVGGDVVLSGNIYNNANLSVQYTTIFPTWTQMGSDIDGEAAGDKFGHSVSMSSDGTRMAIGGIYNDGTAFNAGHVRVYAESGGTWTQVGQDIDGEAAADYFGYSVSMSSDGTRVAIGTGFNDGTGYNAGHVRVYAESGGTWTQVGADIDGEAANDSFGQSVSMSSDGTRVAIGARMADDDAGNAVSHVRVYAESGGTWTQVGSDIEGEAAYDYFGWSVSMSSDGTRVAIGAYGNNGNGSDAGHVRVYAESSGTWTQVGQDIDGEAAYDYSGYSVSMSSDGTRVAIGARANDGSPYNAGHVRVYSESGGTWTQVGNDIDGEAAGDESGYSVSMSSDGTRVAIGAPFNDGTGSNAGHVRVYSESGGTWTQLGSDIDGESGGVALSGSPAPSDRSGHSVSISSDGTRVAIGAPYNDGNGGDAGHVRVFYWPMIRSKKILKENIVEVGGELTVSGNVEVAKELTVTGNATVSHNLNVSGNVEVGGDVVLSGNIYNNANLSVQYTTIIPAWTQVGSDIDGEAASDYSGYSVSMSSDGTRMAIGAPYNDGTDTDAGHVRVYSESSGTWTQVGADIDGEARSDKSGWSVSMSSDGARVAIGAYGNDGNGNLAGHVRVYSESGGTWTQVGQDIDAEAVDDEFGTSVSMSSDGTRVAIGAIYNSGNGTYAGHVRVYSESGGTWTQVGLDIDGEAASDKSGWSVSMSSDGTRVAIGAPFNDGTSTDAGHVRVYSESGGTWTQVGSDIDGEAADDRSGHSVSMSSDGTRVAIGAIRRNPDVNRSDAGHVRVYSESGGTWTQVGSDIDGEAVSDNSGYSVSMSSDGTRVAIGAKGNDGNGYDAGHVRVYAESSGTWTQVGQDIDGEAASDYSGYSVSMSSDGMRVAIGAPYNDGTDSIAGHVRVFDCPLITGSKKILKENIVEVGGELTVSGNATVSSNLTVSGFVGSSGTGALTLPSGATAQQPTGVVGMIRFNSTLNRLEMYNGTAWQGLAEQQNTGGTISTSGGYKIHTFTSSGIFTMTNTGQVEYLVVAGGGAGGVSHGGNGVGGGGAGGFLTGNISLGPGSYTITRGGGGAGSSSSPTTGADGTDSSIANLIVVEGGGGGGAATGGDGRDGGSGGGAATYSYISGGTEANDGGTGVAGPPRQGNNGRSTNGVAGHGGGGGGGAGSAAPAIPTNGVGGAGGSGLANSISGTSTLYAGGGGGTGWSGTTAGGGGSGGGGSGGTTGNNGVNGTDGLGGGGGGAKNGYRSGDGGDGIVIIRYLL